MDKRIQFCGTPLSKSLSDKNNDDGPVTARRVRLNRQQIVKDAQGRQRFHGAFTGGFSAGYYNTVDTVEGFKPRQFITHRGHNRSAGASSFSHKPEDYMDDEDFGEFGIAPRKIRVATSYSSIDSSQNDQPTFGSTPQAKSLSIGQRMLQHMEGGLDWLRELKMFGGQSIDVAKKDFHGLGYKALESRFSSQPSSLLSKNPLSAMLDKEGKRIKISGEAFGTGVLEDDEDYLNSSDLYGYDDMSNYDFQPKSRAQQSTSKTSQPHKDELNLGDPGILADFKLAEDVYTIQLHDGLEDGYKLPDIPVDWRMPSREVPYIPPVDETAASQKLKLIGHQSSSAFNKKFISASEKRLESSEIGTKAGLLHYSDLKATVAPREQDPIVPDAVKATITRVQFEWRPCSLLCKHFNVPNPYPGDPFVGTKTPDQARPLDDQMGLVAPAEKPVLTRQEPASLALKRSIFNVIFQDDQQPVAGRCYADTDSEDEPQIVEDKPAVNAEKADRSDDQDADDQDIVVVNALRPEPELIVLSSSSTSSSFSSPDCRRRRRRHPKASTSRESNEVEEREEELHIDTYGPPLPPKPPTPNTASDLDSHRSNARHRSSSRQRKKKSKKHKKHKRHG